VDEFDKAKVRVRVIIAIASLARDHHTQHVHRSLHRTPLAARVLQEAQAARDDPRLFAPVASTQAQKVAKGMYHTRTQHATRTRSRNSASAYLSRCAGVDPKSILCEFFKAGVCRRGDKCKFSHDPAIERKAAKIDLYTDLRAKEQGAHRAPSSCCSCWLRVVFGTR